MRRCYRGAAFALGGILMTGLTSHDSCSFGALTVYAAEDTLTEELETAFQEEVQTGEENVETDIPAEENTEDPETAEELPGETSEEPAAEDAGPEAGGEEEDLEEPEEEALAEPEEEEEPVEAALAEPAAEEAEPAEEAVEEPEPEAETAEEPAEEPAGNRSGLEEQEYQVLLKIVEAEAGGEDTVGRMLVANVIMNRVRSGRFPNTITEVVYQRCSGRAQFSPVSDGRIDQVSVSPETVEAVSRAINGEDASAGALYFRSVYSSSGWFDRALRRVVEHGNHIFYTM